MQLPKQSAEAATGSSPVGDGQGSAHPPAAHHLVRTASDAAHGQFNENIGRRLAESGALLSTQPLDPERLDETTHKAAVGMLAAGIPANTERSYEAAARYLATWYRLRFGRDFSLPVPPAAFIRFILDHLHSRSPTGQTVKPELPSDIDAAMVAAGCKGKPGPLSLATVNHRISCLARMHKRLSLPSPTDAKGVPELLRSARAIAVTLPGGTPRRAPALTREEMRKLLATCDESLTGKRDRALLLFGWSTGGRRRSEIATADMANLNRVSLDAFSYTLLFTKTTRDGELNEQAVKKLHGSAALAMSDWLSVSKITEGAIFRVVTSTGGTGAPLTDPAVGQIVTRRARAAGLSGHFTAHSLRSGFVTQAHLDGVPIPEAMQMTGHASEAVFNSYFRTDPGAKTQVSQLIDVDKPR